MQVLGHAGRRLVCDPSSRIAGLCGMGALLKQHEASIVCIYAYKETMFRREKWWCVIIAPREAHRTEEPVRSAKSRENTRVHSQCLTAAC